MTDFNRVMPPTKDSNGTTWTWSCFGGSDASSNERVRKRVPWFSMIGIVILVLLTIGNAAANMIPFHVQTAHERQQEEQRTIIEARRARLEALLLEGDQCRPFVAHEIARTLVFDGHSARAYAADYQQRCGDDPVVERWGNAPQPRRKVVLT